MNMRCYSNMTIGPPGLVTNRGVGLWWGQRLDTIEWIWKHLPGEGEEDGGSSLLMDDSGENNVITRGRTVATDRAINCHLVATCREFNLALDKAETPYWKSCHRLPRGRRGKKERGGL